MQISLWTGQIHHSDGLDQTVDSFTNQTRCPSTWPIIFPRDQLYSPRDQLSSHVTNCPSTGLRNSPEYNVTPH